MPPGNRRKHPMRHELDGGKQKNTRRFVPNSSQIPFKSMGRMSLADFVHPIQRMFYYQPGTPYFRAEHRTGTQDDTPHQSIGDH